MSSHTCLGRKREKYKKELTNPRYILSSRVVYLLFENDLVEPMELDESIMYTQYYDKVCDFSDLTYNEFKTRQSWQ